MRIDIPWEIGDKCWTVVVKRVGQTRCEHCHHDCEPEWGRETCEVEITSIEVRIGPNGKIIHYGFDLSGDRRHATEIFRTFKEADATRLPDDCY